MAANKTITSVNSKINLIFTNPWANSTATDAINGVSSAAGTVVGAISPLIGVPLTLDCLTSNNPFRFSTQRIVATQTAMDGTKFGGYLAGAANIELTVSFISTSDSLATLQQIAQIMSVQRETMKCSGTLIMPSQNKTYDLTDGYWTNWKQIPDHADTLQPVDCIFEFTSATLTES